MKRLLLVSPLAGHRASYPLDHRARFQPCDQLGHQPVCQAAVWADGRIDGQTDGQIGHAVAQTEQLPTESLSGFFLEQFGGRR